MTPLEIRRTQGNYVNNDAGAFVDRENQRIREQELINMMDPNPESPEIEAIKLRLNKIEIFNFELRGEMVRAIIGYRDASFFQDKLDEYGSEKFDLERKLREFRGEYHAK